MKHILLQAGHEGVTTGATGAPGEQEKNIRIRGRLGQILIEKGFQVFLCDAKYSSSEDYDLALSLHCDANYAGDEGGGFVDFPDPQVDDNNTESKRIKEAIESEYFKHSGIRNMPNRSNPNTKFYYWWSMLSSKTPCVIIEMGESIDPHDAVLLADTERIANALARGICTAFNVDFDGDEKTKLLAQLQEAQATVNTQKEELTKRDAQIKELTTQANKQAITIADRDKEIKDLKLQLSAIPQTPEMSPTLSNVIALFRLWLKGWLK